MLRKATLEHDKVHHQIMSAVSHTRGSMGNIGDRVMMFALQYVVLTLLQPAEVGHTW